MKNMKPLMAAFILGALFAAGSIYWSIEADSAQASAVPAAQAGTVADGRALFKVDSISCYSCEATIKKALAEVKGVVTVDVDVKGRAVAVDYDRKTTDSARIGDAITASGYPAAFLSDGAPVPAKPGEQRNAVRARGGCGSGCCGG